MKRIIAFLTLSVLVMGLFAGCSAVTAKESTKKETTQLTSGTNTNTTTSDTDSDTATNAATGNEQETTPTVDTSLVYFADINVADYGKITVQLDSVSAPATVANFVKLAESGFYNGLTFHRIMEGFMMQGGCPEGTGFGGAEENVVGEFLANGYNNTLSHTRGAISMARAANPDSGSSQFFIVHQDSTFLDGQYACFGYVTEGIEVVDAVCEASEPTDSNGTIPASAQPVITSITIRTESQ